MFAEMGFDVENSNRLLQSFVSSVTEILDSIDAFYRRFYFRAGKLAEMSAELFRRPDMASRRLREGSEFVRFLNRRTREA